MKTPPMPMGNSDLRDANGERRPDRSYSDFDITKGRMQTYPKHPNECFHTRQVAHAANVTKFICEDCGKTMSDER
jgi:hypothetical protein